MIQLPPGCTINYPIRIVVNELTQDIVEWYELIGGTISESNNEYDWRTGLPIKRKFVQYGSGKNSYHMQDGSKNVLLHFNQDDANIALMFIMKFSDIIKSHNIQDYQKYVY